MTIHFYNKEPIRNWQRENNDSWEHLRLHRSRKNVSQLLTLQEALVM